ncbi:MAG: hypothetical protein Kapaf2KO_12790 [Candidatus Kapaibacteriales bacterium]
MNKVLALIFFIVGVSIIKASEHNLVTDRPGFYNNPQIMDKGSLVLELGIQNVWFSSNKYTIEPNINTLKYGVGEQVELRLGLGYQLQYMKLPNLEVVGAEEEWAATENQNLATFGAKVGFLETTSDLLSAELNLSLPPFLDANSISPYANISLLYTRKLHEEFALSSNLRYTFLYSDFPNEDILDIHLAFEHAVSENFGWLVESWTNVNSQTFQVISELGEEGSRNTTNSFTGGNLAFWYRPVPSIQIDAQGGLFTDNKQSSEDNQPNIILNLGASFLLN